MAERQRARLHDPELRRPWLYALARWACLRRLSQDGRPVPAKAAADVAAQRRRELSALAWPEAAGTTPEQREALELAVRHQLAPNEVAHVVGIEPDAARALLAQAACEVERTRAALAVVELGRCPAVARLAGDTQVLLGPALRRELVRHVDECPDCRFTAERAVATAPWPGLAATTAATAVLAVIEAPRPAAYAALLDSMRAACLPHPREHPALRPARLPPGRTGPSGPARAAEESCRHLDGHRRGRRRAGARAVGRVSRRLARP